MKARQIFSALIVSCGIAAFASMQAFAQTNQTQAQALPGLDDHTVYVSTAGLQTGSVDIKITNDGKTYYFTGYGGSSVFGEVRLGSFQFTGTYFDIEITPHNVYPGFWRFAGAAFLSFETPESYSSRVSWNDEPLGDAGVVVVFQNRY